VPRTVKASANCKSFEQEFAEETEKLEQKFQGLSGTRLSLCYLCVANNQFLRTVREFRSTDFSPFDDGLKSVLLGCGYAAPSSPVQ
jgi:hypothetical protein